MTRAGLPAAVRPAARGRAGLPRGARLAARLASGLAVGLVAFHVAFEVLDAACPLPAAALAAPPPSGVVTAADGTWLRVGLDGAGERRLPFARADASPHLVHALLASEDRRFLVHRGVDPRALVRAAARCLVAGAAVEGGSTLTMQLARLVDPTPRTVAGKVWQAVRAWQLERRLPKDEILARYLEAVPLPGNLRGATAAAAAWWGKRPADLSADEAATIVGVLPAPNRFDPRRHPEAARARRDAVLAAMRDEGWLTDEACRAAQARPVAVAADPFPDGAPHLASRAGAGATALVPATQREVERIAAAVPPPDGVAIVVVDVATATVTALAGARVPRADGGDASGRPRSAGSTLKPFLYALALDRGLVARDTPVLDLPWASPDWAPVNFDPGFAGPVPASEALAVSLNLPAVRLAAALPRDAFAGVLAAYGFARVRAPEGRRDADLALGTDDVTPLELAEAATALASGGLHRPLRFVADGPPARATRVTSAGAAALVTAALASSTRARPPGAPRAGVAWKTGTSSGRRDAWAVGWTTRVAVVVWRGRLDGAGDDALVGARLAVPTWFDVLAVADPDPAPFPPPADRGVVEVEVCATTGLAAGPACAGRRADLRPADAAPLAPCDAHVRAAFDAATGALRCERCRAGHAVVARDVLVLPAAWAAWRRQAGLAVDVLPPHAADCPDPQDPPAAGPRVVSPRPGTRLEARADGRASVVVAAVAADPGPLRLALDGVEAGARDRPGRRGPRGRHRPPHVGRHGRGRPLGRHPVRGRRGAVAPNPGASPRPPAILHRSRRARRVRALDRARRAGRSAVRSPRVARARARLHCPAPMRCPACHADLPTPTDPTQRRVRCAACGKDADLAAVAGFEGTIATPPPAPAATPPDPLVGTSFAGGRYRIEALLGVGGMGRVYRATQTALGRAVAIKILSPELARDEQFRRRFDREAGTLASLDHPHIVAVHDMGVEDGTPYIVMAIVAGRDGHPVTLRQLLDAGPVEEDLCLRVIQQTCDALDYAHRKGIVHRDIKPANILLDAAGNAKIADFGIARAGGAEAAALTTTGAVLGTLKYMAPEQMSDSSRADPRSDLYSLGVVFYELLTGHAPIGRFELPSEERKGLDHRLDAIVDRALRRAADQRYQSADQMARDLSRITTERDLARLGGAAGGKATPSPDREARPAPAGVPAAAVGRAGGDATPAAATPSRGGSKGALVAAGLLALGSRRISSGRRRRSRRGRRRSSAGSARRRRRPWASPRWASPRWGRRPWASPPWPTRR
ncbi:MAG: transglycosylase domain-containing protein [Planctomycetota bacterium]